MSAFCALLTVAHFLFSLGAAEILPPEGAASTNCVFIQVRPGVFELGGIRFDQKARTASFRAAVNLREGPIEYVVVTTSGKIHESLLRTDVAPQHLHIAMLLLGAKGAGTNALQEDPAQALPGDRVTVELSWTDKGRTRRVPADKFILDRKAKRTLRKGSWVYTGSRLRDDGFAAQQDGSIVSLITDPDALINNSRPGREDDDNWLPFSKGLPPAETVVEVTLRLGR
jgi:hypothetical protein